MTPVLIAPAPPRILICVVCERRIDPKREAAPAQADVKAHKRCAEMR